MSNDPISIISHDTLKWWQELASINPNDLIPRIQRCLDKPDKLSGREPDTVEVSNIMLDHWIRLASTDPNALLKQLQNYKNNPVVSHREPIS